MIQHTIRLYYRACLCTFFPFMTFLWNLDFHTLECANQAYAILCASQHNEMNNFTTRSINRFLNYVHIKNRDHPNWRNDDATEWIGRSWHFNLHSSCGKISPVFRIVCESVRWRQDTAPRSHTWPKCIEILNFT